MDVVTHLRALADAGDEFRKFTERITPTGYEFLGVRIPVLRKLAKEIANGDGVDEYLERGLDGEITIFEEVMLYGLVLAARARKMPLEEVFRRLERLIPLFDNWAHVDVVISDFKIFRKHQDEVMRRFLPFKTSGGEFTKRTFVILLKDYFLDAGHIDATLAHFTEVPQGQYYTDMAIAWALAEALVKHYDRTEPLLHGGVFSQFVHNKAIQKARESFRITPDKKKHLNTLQV
jgi:3-methyladenine DNA glycosylase AlkD